MKVVCVAVAGIMMPNEQEIIENIKTPYNKYVLPIIWAMNIVYRARTERRIRDEVAQARVFTVSFSILFILFNSYMEKS